MGSFIVIVPPSALSHHVPLRVLCEQDFIESPASIELDLHSSEDAEMNAVIEMHDSECIAVEVDENDGKLIFSYSTSTVPAV